MCLIVFAWKHHPDYPLIMAANRDEYYQRPTVLADFWEDQPNILAGRDLTSGGTWLGINRQGRFAAVTNYREGHQQLASRSRGELTANFLGSDIDAKQYAQHVIDEGDQYNGFNLLLGDGDQLYYCSNRQSQLQQVPPGIYSLSNHLLDSPWPKAIHAKEVLEPLLKTNSVDRDLLIQSLQRREPFADEHLPDTGVGLEMERMLSPPFIASKDYGTRCTTVLLKKYQEKNNQIETTLVEQNYGDDGVPSERSTFNLIGPDRADQ
ncbi:MAG: NRDE family protein [Porticoccus sp.]|nr:NRDE family protein [Porticoccus sp.]